MSRSLVLIFAGLCVWGNCGSSCPKSPVFEEIRVDLLELNHYYKSNNRVFSQLIYWKEYPTVGLDKATLHAVGYLILDDRNLLMSRPIKTKAGYESLRLVQRGSRTRMVRVVSSLYRESHTNVDPERESVELHWKGKIIPDLFGEAAAIDENKEVLDDR